MCLIILVITSATLRVPPLTLYATIFGKGTNSGAVSGFGEKWGWFIAIKRIGREYRLTPSEVVERFNINEFLTEIEYLDDEYKEQEKNIKNAKRNI